MPKKMQFFVNSFDSIDVFKNRWKKLSFGCSDLDKLTDGGIGMRGVNEICGESGSGKTQICLQLSLIAQLPIELGGTGKGTVYICTEESFNSRRLLGMIDGVFQRYSYDERVKDIKFMDNIYIIHLTSEIEECIMEKLPKLLAIKDIGLVVIDSITGPFIEVTDYIERSDSMKKLVHNLHRFSEIHDLAVVCTNQVRSIQSSCIEDHEDLAAMSLGWSSLVNTRFQLYRLPNSVLRKFQVVFSPSLSQNHSFFTIKHEGVVNYKA